MSPNNYRNKWISETTEFCGHFEGITQNTRVAWGIETAETGKSHRQNIEKNENGQKVEDRILISFGIHLEKSELEKKLIRQLLGKFLSFLLSYKSVVDYMASCQPVPRPKRPVAMRQKFVLLSRAETRRLVAGLFNRKTGAHRVDSMSLMVIVTYCNYPLDPSGDLTYSYSTWLIEIVSFPIKHVIFHSYAKAARVCPMICFIETDSNLVRRSTPRLGIPWKWPQTPNWSFSL